MGALMWTMIGRMVLALLIGGHKNNWIYQMFVKMTDWYLVLLSRVTMGFTNGGLSTLWGFFSIIAVRIVVYMVFYQFGLTPPVDV